MEKKFNGKVALVTGAGSGIGQAAALRLAKNGAIVAVNHRPGKFPEETLAMIKDARGKAFPVEADMRVPEQVDAMIATTAEKHGRLDYVVSNAAVNPFVKWDETTIEDFNHLSEVNIRGTWLVCTGSARQMIREGHGGAIVIVSSISAHVSSPFQVAYCATKGALSRLGKSLGSVLGEHGIRVNVVEPGLVRTKMSTQLFEDKDALKYYHDRIALHRAAEPGEIASVIEFLLSDDAGYLTSATLLADGGFIVNAEL